jgi:hypothetical protein
VVVVVALCRIGENLWACGRRIARGSWVYGVSIFHRKDVAIVMTMTTKIWIGVVKDGDGC